MTTNSVAADATPERWLLRGQIGPFLIENGYPPISHSILDKHGPPIDGWWGNRAIYKPATALKWAQERLRRVDSNAAAA